MSSARPPRNLPTQTALTEPFSDCSTLPSRIGRANANSVRFSSSNWASESCFETSQSMYFVPAWNTVAPETTAASPRPEMTLPLS